MVKTKASFVLVAIYENEIVKESAKEVTVELELNKPNNFYELKKELIPIMIKLMNNGFEAMDSPLPAVVITGFLDDDSDSFQVTAINEKKTGFTCGKIYLYPEPAALLS